MKTSEEVEIKRGRRKYSPEMRRELLARFKASGLSQTEFCLREDVTFQTLSRWLRMDAGPSISAFHKPVKVDFGMICNVCMEFPNGIRLKWPAGMKTQELVAVAKELVRC